MVVFLKHARHARAAFFPSPAGNTGPFCVCCCLLCLFSLCPFLLPFLVSDKGQKGSRGSALDWLPESAGGAVTSEERLFSGAVAGGGAGSPLIMSPSIG